jgi:hypothetical protein
MSSFSWLDYAEADRRAAMDVIDLFREQETVDELGIGSVRDTFSDLLFPSTSAIQTRARYFLIIPWIYQRLEKSKVESALVADRARSAELALIDALLESEDAEQGGIIGARAKRSLKRLPSMVYWQGLGRLGIRRFPGGRDQYHRSLDAYYARTSGTITNDDGEVIEYGKTRNWDNRMPSAPAGFPRTCSLSLTSDEAKYLRDRIRYASPTSLFAVILDGPAPADDAAFPWDHARALQMPSVTDRHLRHARNFSESMHGAALLYNLILSDKLGYRELIETDRQALSAWVELIREALPRLLDWDVADFWQLVLSVNGRIPIPTRAFIDTWLGFVRGPHVESVAEYPAARDWISDRERLLKRGLARVNGGRPLELFHETGAAGTRQLDYRWKATARRMTLDIQEGISRGNA